MRLMKPATLPFLAAFLSLGLLFPAVASAAIAHNIVLIVVDDVSAGAIWDYRNDPVLNPETTGSDVRATTADQLTTDTIDAVAAAGYKVENFFVEPTCTQTRATLLGFGHTNRLSHRLGSVSPRAMNSFDADNEIYSLPVNGPYNLIRQLSEQGIASEAFGKFHLIAPEEKNAETRCSEFGFEQCTNIMQGGGPLVEGTYENDITALDRACLSHNHYVRGDKGGNYEIAKDISGDSTYTTDDIIGAAVTAIGARTGTEANPKFWYISPSAPHSPFEAPTGNGSCSIGTGSASSPQNTPGNRPPSPYNTGSTLTEIQRNAFQYLDEQLEDITTHGSLDFGSGGNDILIIVGDNGEHVTTSADECLDSRGQKRSPYPCGVRTFAVIKGGTDVISGSNQTLTLPLDAADMSKTILDLATGGTHQGRHSDGYSFAECLDGTVAAGSCTAGRPMRCHYFWKPNGGTKNYATIDRPPTRLDKYDEWQEVFMGCYYKTATDYFHITRIYDETTGVDDPTPAATTELLISSETFQNLAGSNRYSPSAIDFRASSSGNALVEGDFSSPTVTELQFLTWAQNYFDSIFTTPYKKANYGGSR